MDQPPFPLRMERPKRALNAFNFFFQKERERLLSELPDNANERPRRGHGKITFQDLARKVAAGWKNVSIEYKEYCLALAKEDKLRFNAEKAEYNATRKYIRKQRRMKNTLLAAPSILPPCLAYQAPTSSQNASTEVKERNTNTDLSATERDKHMMEQGNDDELEPTLVFSNCVSGQVNADPFYPTTEWLPVINDNKICKDISQQPYDALLNVSQITQKLDKESQEFLVRTFLP